MFELTPYERRHNRGYLFNPFQEFDDLEKAFFGNHSIADFKTDIKENGDTYLLEAELPGFEKKDIKIDIDDNYLTVSAERKDEHEEKDKKGNYLRRERSYGSFRRSFDVSGINTDSISAAYENGVLKLTLPKKDQKLPNARRLEIE